MSTTALIVGALGAILALVALGLVPAACFAVGFIIGEVVV